MGIATITPINTTAERLQIQIICILCAPTGGGVMWLKFASSADAISGGGVVSVGYAIAHPRLNPVGILPPGSRPSDVAAVCIIGQRIPMRAYSIRPNPSHRYREYAYNYVVAITCEACEAET